jgi:tetratricopeptide (TPR) repeat protein
MTSSQDEELAAASEHYHSGKSALEAGDAAGAIRHLEESFRAWPHFKTAELLGEALAGTGRTKEAVGHLAAAVGLGNKAFRARYLLAQCLITLNQKADAYRLLKEALELAPQFKKARELLERLSQDEEIRTLIASEQQG